VAPLSEPPLDEDFVATLERWEQEHAAQILYEGEQR
jgi:hypothetical protein